MKRAVVLLSGGIDSTTALAVAKSEGHEIYALSFDYGQRHKVELHLAREHAAKFNAVKHLIIDFNLRGIGGSALTDDIEVPKTAEEERKPGIAEDEKHQLRIPVTYVPARNTIFLSFALAWAETLKAENIFIGANAVDYSGYPDCRPLFLQAFEDMANVATKVSAEGKIRFRIRAPLIELSKGKIIKKGNALGVDFSLTWSCYDPVAGTGRHKEGPRIYKPCMRCDSCRFRAKGFQEAGIDDPLVSGGIN